MPAGDVFDVLKKMPGVRVSQDNDIALRAGAGIRKSFLKDQLSLQLSFAEPMNLQ